MSDIFFADDVSRIHGLQPSVWSLALQTCAGCISEPGCRPDWIYTSAGLINTLYDFILDKTRMDPTNADAEFLFLRNADLEELILLSHSLGGAIALDVLTGAGMA